MKYFIMDQQNALFLGCVAVAVAVSVYLLWTPSPRTRRKIPAITGLVNLGQTCFLNTLLQALASCAIFVEWLDQQATDEKILTSALQKILWVLNGHGNEVTHSPENVLHVLKKIGWVVPAGEQDAHELFHCMISTLQEENAKIPKAGSLSDALPLSDTLSQASDMSEDPFESLDPIEGIESPQSVSEPVSLYEERTESEQFFSVNSSESTRTLKMHSPKASEDSLKRGIVARSGTGPPCTLSETPPFTGLLASSLTCCQCGYVSSIRTDTFDSVSLTLGDSLPFTKLTLNKLVQQFVKTEILPDVRCDKCVANTSAIKTYNFGKLPQCLCFHVVRTAWSSESNTSSKREDHVEFPEYLVMDPFTWRPGTQPPSDIPTARTAKHLYRLKSVVVHLGSIHSGHFVTYRRGPLNSSRRHMADGKARCCVDDLSWYVVSDENVRQSTMSTAMDALAYMLFYEKCTSGILQSLLGECAVVT